MQIMAEAFKLLDDPAKVMQKMAELFTDTSPVVFIDAIQKYIMENTDKLELEKMVNLTFRCLSSKIVEMVKFDNAKTDADKKTHFRKMLSMAEAHKAKILEGDAFRYFESWKHQVLRELAPAMPGAKPLALAHACRPDITAAEVTVALNFLVKAGLLKKDEQGRYIQTDTYVSTGPMDVTPVAVRGLHRQMGEIALEAIEGVPQDQRHFSGLTLGITRDAYGEIVQKIAEFRKELVAIATRDSATDEVYRLNVQFFPMTKKGINKKG